MAGRPSSLPPSGLVLGIFGATGSGKTAVAAEVARRIPAELVSADSMQVYSGLPVLTNQDAEARLVGIWPLDRQRTVGEYQRLAHEAIDEVVAAGRTPIVVGGSGLWFQAALTDVDFPAEVPTTSRARWERLYDRRGAVVAHALLQHRDPRAAGRVHPNDRKRVVRALELWDAGATLVPEEPRLWTASLRLPTLLVGLEVARDELERRLRRRAESMFERGVEDEVRAARAVVPQVLGLEAVRTLPREQALEELVRATGRLAGYQRKWMRRVPGMIMLDANRPAGEVADAVLEVARARPPGFTPQTFHSHPPSARSRRHRP